MFVLRCSNTMRVGPRRGRSLSVSTPAPNVRYVALVRVVTSSFVAQLTKQKHHVTRCQGRAGFSQFDFYLAHLKEMHPQFYRQSTCTSCSVLFIRTLCARRGGRTYIESIPAAVTIRVFPDMDAFQAWADEEEENTYTTMSRSRTREVHDGAISLSWRAHALSTPPSSV